MDVGLTVTQLVKEVPRYLLVNELTKRVLVIEDDDLANRVKETALKRLVPVRHIEAWPERGKSDEFNRHVSAIENDVQDRTTDAWKALCRYMDELEEGLKNFPRERHLALNLRRHFRASGIDREIEACHQD